MLVGGADGGWRDWWVAAVVGVRLWSSVFGSVLVMVVCEGVVAIGRQCCFRWCSSGAVRVLARSVVGDALVVSACGSWSWVVTRALSLVREVQVVSVTARLVPLVRAVWLLCQGLVALVTVTVVHWGLVPVVALRW